MICCAQPHSLSGINPIIAVSVGQRYFFWLLFWDYWHFGFQLFRYDFCVANSINQLINWLPTLSQFKLREMIPLWNIRIINIRIPDIRVLDNRIKCHGGGWLVGDNGGGGRQGQPLSQYTYSWYWLGDITFVSISWSCTRIHGIFHGHLVCCYKVRWQWKETRRRGSCPGHTCWMSSPLTPPSTASVTSHSKTGSTPTSKYIQVFNFLSRCYPVWKIHLFQTFTLDSLAGRTQKRYAKSASR